RLERGGVASEVVLETGRPQAAEVRWGVSELPLQERARVAHAVDASVLGQPARLAEEVVVLGQEGVVRRWRRQQPGRVLLGEHSEQMAERGQVHRVPAREAWRAGAVR